MDTVYAISMLLLGCCLGSFYACMGYRVPNGISIINPGSYCENCKKTLKWYMNIPVLSYLILGGRCAYCKKRIDVSGLLLEIFTGITFLFSYLAFGFCYQLIVVDILISALAVTAVSDFKYYYISDRVVFGSVILIALTYVKFLKFSEYKTYLIGALLMFILMLTIKVVGDKVFKKECLGGGDVKLMLLVGISLGFMNGLLSLFISSILALLAHYLLREKYNEDLIPFGPFLIMGAIIVYIMLFNGFAF